MPRRNLHKWFEETVAGYEFDTNPESFEALSLEYQRLLIQDRENTWARADLAHLAAQTFGKLRRLSIETGESYNYLKQLSYVSGQYDKHIRNTFWKLTIRHFRAVAHLEHRYVLLQKAQEQGWTVDRLLKEANLSAPEKFISLNKVVSTLNSHPKEKFKHIDAMSLLNIALGTAGKIKWNGKKFEIEEVV